MKLSKRQLRRIIRTSILEAKFDPKKPLNRDAIQVALGAHPIQELKNSERYQKAKEEMVSFVDIMFDQGEEDDLTSESFVDTFEDYYSGIAHYYGSGELETAQYQMVFEDLLDEGELRISDGRVFIPNTGLAK